MHEPGMTRSPTTQRSLAVATIILIVSASLWSGTASAQESDEWKFRITPYLWMLSLEGTTATLGQDVDVDASFSDIFDVLNIALSANMELSKGKFFVVFDPMYAQLELDFAGPDGTSIGGKLEIDMVIADLNFGYSFDENFGIYAGARYYDQDITLTPNLLPQQSLGDDWTDFIVGLRAGGKVSENWSFMGKMDAAVGGDSESAYYFQAILLRHFGDNKHLNIGWRHYDVDYESGSGLSRFKWDVEHTGPVVGFSWEFGG
jgi:hypothetical protein